MSGAQCNWRPLGSPEPSAGWTLRDGWVSTGTQEDIDLLVAFAHENVTWLLLVEAKGFGGWTNKQVQAKLRRLGRIESDMTPAAKAAVQLRLCLASPKESAGLIPGTNTGWPEWMVHPAKKKPYWIKLPVPGGRKKVTGCDKGGTPSDSRRYWKVEPVGTEELVNSD